MPAIWLNLAIAGKFLRRPRMSLPQLTLMGREDDALKVEAIVHPISRLFLGHCCGVRSTIFRFVSLFICYCFAWKN